MTEQVRAHLIISGRVQGVFFRAETHRAAQRFNVTGWVRNLPDGRVEALLEGPRLSVEQTIAWCHQGPPRSRVDNIQIDWEAFQGDFKTFQIRY